MVKTDYTKIVKVGDSKMVRVSARLIKDNDYPFDRDNAGDLIMSISKDKRGKKGLFIKKHEE